MVLTGFLTGHQLFQTGQRTERVHNDLTDIAVATQEKLPFGNISRVVRHGMRDVAPTQRRHGDNGNGTARRKLYGFLVNLGQIGIQRTGHGVLRRNLIHTVGHDGQRVGV